jgi:hypothetical protein
VTRNITILVLAAAVCAIAASESIGAARQPLVVVVRQGGLCAMGSGCRSMLRITDTTISGDGYLPRPLSASARRALTGAIADLSASYLRRHPFKRVCPTAYDAPESTYRFRGFAQTIPSCAYDVGGVRAVRLTESLLATLKARRG